MKTLAKILLTLAAIQYGFVPPIVDFSASHVFHPEWTPHSRFYLVWLLSLGAILASYVLVNLWLLRSQHDKSLRQVSLVGCFVLGSFFLAVLTLKSYGGSLTDIEEPVRVLGVDGNVFAFSIASVFQGIGTYLTFRGTKNT